ncbi:MAG: MFS transporter [Nanoarchaeota archaeon]|nr:MFS transporter [Nanoarchaeota archaeon]MBU1644128.1 MFS transporter [Nanoarchaeota archaeon]MBU1976464.1 MFS transporter [Nanoarchaeota archaeon]
MNKYINAIRNIVVAPELYFSRIKTGFFLLLFYSVCANFSSSFIPFYFKEQGYSLPWIILLYIIIAFVGIIFIPFMRYFSVRTYLLISFLIFSSALASLAFLPYFISLYVYAFLISLNLIFFWLPLNYLFFLKSSKNTNAVDSSLYMVAPGLIAMILPLLGAAVADSFGYTWLFGLAALLYLFPIIFVHKKIVEEKITTISFKEGVRNFKGLKTITLLEGALQYFSGIVVVVYSLLFLKTNLEMGYFLSYLGLLGFVIGMLLSRYSDKNQKRKNSIFILFLLMSLSIFILPFVKESFYWFIAVGIFSVIYTISSPLRLAVSLDVRVTDMNFWKIREFFLNVGRVVILLLTIILFTFKQYFFVFAFFGLIALAYPFLVSYKLKEIK